MFWSNGRGEWLQAQVTLEWICARVAPTMIPPDEMCLVLGILPDPSLVELPR